MVQLSVLDQSTAAIGVPEAQSIRDTVALAQYCEELGYKRFWVSEHHNHPTIVGTAPEIRAYKGWDQLEPLVRQACRQSAGAS